LAQRTVQPERQLKLFIASGIIHPEPGGPATYLHELLPALLERGWDIRALSYSDAVPSGGWPPTPYPVTRIERASLPVRTLRYAAAARPLLAWADVVYIHTLGLPLSGSRRAPRVVKIVGDLAWERAIRKGWIAPTEDIDLFQTRRYTLPVMLDKAARARDARSMDAVIVPSEYLKRIVIGWGVDPAKVQVIYNALPHSPHPSPSGRGESGIMRLDPLTRGAGSAVILTAGRLLPWKGVDRLIEALALANQDGLQVCLQVAGDGPELARLQTLTEMLGVSDQVEFLGRVGRVELAALMRAADYVALYSGYEGLSHTLLESLREGTPVIASDKGGNPEVVRHGVNGLLVPYFPAQPDKAARALADALADACRPGAREQFAAATHIGMERFHFTYMVEATAAVLSAIAR
jgi:glycosyltransferase involved in cell wall biosynthesis